MKLITPILTRKFLGSDAGMIKYVASMRISLQQWQQDLNTGASRNTLRLMLVALLFLGILFNSSAAPSDVPSATPVPASPSQTFAVAMPELEGLVTFGIFSPTGDLVRLLYRDATMESIPIGINGSLMTWDEADSTGKLLPVGTYHARGLVHGPISISALPLFTKSWNALKLAPSPLQESFCPDLNALFSSHRITILAAKDKLQETRPLLVLSAKKEKKSVVILVNGLPLAELPVDSAVISPEIKLGHGALPGTAELTLQTRYGTESYTLSGIDQIVPLEAGSLEIPADASHSPPVGK